ncbi:MAG: hypothetical protein GEV03_13420 [Streptosporangiales bacterium]|nr:hypothetical protein [Streptosporangiales bacterium]
MIDSDDALLAELRDLFEAMDPVPAQVVAAAEASFTWRTIDAELAALVADSAERPLAGVRSQVGQAGPRLLTFEGQGLLVEVEIDSVGTDRRLVGQLVPPKPAEVEVRWPGGSLTRIADEVGHFTVDAVPQGPVSLVCRLADTAKPVATSWVTI